MTDTPAADHAPAPAWHDDVDEIVLAVAQRRYERVRGPGEAQPWRAPVAYLVGAGALLTRPDANRLADHASRYQQVDADEARRQLDRAQQWYQRDTAGLRRTVDAVRRTVDHRRKTIRTADVVEALDGDSVLPTGLDDPAGVVARLEALIARHTGPDGEHPVAVAELHNVLTPGARTMRPATIEFGYSATCSTCAPDGIPGDQP